MIAHTIQMAEQSGLFDQVVVSTDDMEIAKIAEAYQGVVPFIRPAELADDLTTTAPVIAHAIRTLQMSGAVFKHVCCIYPCTPFLLATDLQNAYLKLVQSKKDFVISVAKFETVIQRALKLQPDETLSSFYPEYEAIRTQDLEPAYYDAGQFYWGTVSGWLTNRSLHNGSLGYLIANERAIDIDTHEDWRRAELLYNLELNK